MKTNKKFLLTLALAAACAQPIYGMNYVHFGLSKAQEHWKPLATAFAVIGVGTALYCYFTSKTSPEESYDTKIKALEQKGPLLILEELQTLAQQIDKTEDQRKMYSLYKNVDTLFKTISPEIKKALLLYNQQQLRADSKDEKNVLRHLSKKIKCWYKKENIPTRVHSLNSKEFCLLKIEKIKDVAKKIDKMEDRTKIHGLYRSAEKIFESTHPDSLKKVLLFNDKYLLTNSKSSKSVLRHLSEVIKECYLKEKLYN